MPSIAPVFMFGFERSGTTLLSMMVGAHPQIAVPLSTTGLWYRYGNALSASKELETLDSLGRVIDDILREERVRLWDAELDHASLVEASRFGEFGSVVAAFHAGYAARMGKPYWASMDISTLYHMEDAYEIAGTDILEIWKADYALYNEIDP